MKPQWRLHLKIFAAVWSCILTFVGLKLIQPRMQGIWPGWVNGALNVFDGEIREPYPSLSIEDRTRLDLDELRGALIARKNKLGKYPTTTEGLAALTQGKLMRNGQTVQLTVGFHFDQWGQPFVYRHPHPATPNDPNTYDLFSLGPDGVVSGDDVR